MTDTEYKPLKYSGDIKEKILSSISGTPFEKSINAKLTALEEREVIKIESIEEIEKTEKPEIPQSLPQPPRWRKEPPKDLPDFLKGEFPPKPPEEPNEPKKEPMELKEPKKESKVQKAKAEAEEPEESSKKKKGKFRKEKASEEEPVKKPKKKKQKKEKPEKGKKSKTDKKKEKAQKKAEKQKSKTEKKTKVKRKANWDLFSRIPIILLVVFAILEIVLLAYDFLDHRQIPPVAYYSITGAIIVDSIFATVMTYLVGREAEPVTDEDAEQLEEILSDDDATIDEDKANEDEPDEEEPVTEESSADFEMDLGNEEESAETGSSDLDFEMDFSEGGEQSEENDFEMDFDEQLEKPQTDDIMMDFDESVSPAKKEEPEMPDFFATRSMQLLRPEDIKKLERVQPKPAPEKPQKPAEQVIIHYPQVIPVATTPEEKGLTTGDVSFINACLSETLFDAKLLPVYQMERGYCVEMNGKYYDITDVIKKPTNEVRIEYGHLYKLIEDDNFFYVGRAATFKQK